MMLTEEEYQRKLKREGKKMSRPNKQDYVNREHMYQHDLDRWKLDLIEEEKNKSVNQQLADNMDRPDRHSIGGSMNRPVRNEDPLSPRNISHEVNSYNIGTSDYNVRTIQPWDIIAMYNLDFFEGNILKYLLRKKGTDEEDLKKIIHYAEKKLSLME